MNCRQADFSRYSIVLEILLEMRFCAVFGVTKKSGVARLFKVFATAVLANFQDRLVMIDSVSLRILSAKVTETATIEPEPKYIEETVQEI